MARAHGWSPSSPRSERLTPIDLSSRLSGWREAVNAELAGMAAAHPGSDAVSEALRYALSAGGKRLRPILCLAAAEAVDGAVDGAGAETDGAQTSRAGEHPTGGGATGTDAGTYRHRLRAAASIELMHTYSLVHDDLPCMDNDDLRRGRRTAHRVFGTAPAMLAGFALIPLACRTLAEAAAALQPGGTASARVVAELCRGAGAGGMVGGQLLDLEAERAPVELAALRRIHALKTGALFGASLRIGGILAGARPAVTDALGSFGESLGLSFQITDDVLDETMDAGALGKTPGKDRDTGKSTFVSLLGVAGARDAAAAELAAAVAGLRDAGIASPLLERLAGFAVGRDR
jgi:geranylgeranyl pyrophosphate synthase